MKNRELKISLMFLLIIASLIFLKNDSNAASFSASISKTTVTVGSTFTVTVKANNAAGMYSVSKSNSNVSVSKGSTSEFLDNGSSTITFKAVKPGTVTITAKASDMTDLDNDKKKVSGTKTFNVTVKGSSGTSTSTGNKSDSDKSDNQNKNDDQNKNDTKPTFTSVNETVYAKSQVNVRASYSTSSNILGSLNTGDKVTRIGKSSEWSKVTYNGQTAYISSSYLTTTKPDKSNNKNLKILKVIPSNLSPAFKSSVTEYSMKVGSDVDSIKVDAKAEDSKAKVSVSGNKNLSIGENTITIKVTAEDKTVRTYKIAVTKEEKEQLKLSELTIADATLEPSFDSNVYEYKIKLPNPDTKEIDITAVPSRSDASIEIVGDTNLQAGENIVTILVKSEDGEEITTYQIVVNVPETAAGITNSDLYKYIGIGAAIVVILLIIIIVVAKKKNKSDFETYYGGYSFNNFEDKEEKQEEKKQDYTSNIGMDLSEEDIPKSLRKEKEENFEDFNINTNNETDYSTDIDKKKIIDSNFGDFGNDDDYRPRKKGKHF